MSEAGENPFSEALMDMMLGGLSGPTNRASDRVATWKPLRRNALIGVKRASIPVAEFILRPAVVGLSGAGLPPFVCAPQNSLLPLKNQTPRSRLTFLESSFRPFTGFLRDRANPCRWLHFELQTDSPGAIRFRSPGCGEHVYLSVWAVHRPWFREAQFNSFLCSSSSEEERVIANDEAEIAKFSYCTIFSKRASMIDVIILKKRSEVLALK